MGQSAPRARAEAVGHRVLAEIKRAELVRMQLTLARSPAEKRLLQRTLAAHEETIRLHRQVLALLLRGPH